VKRFYQNQRMLILASVAVLFLATTALPMQSTSVRRVRLPRGRTTAVLRGSIVNDGMNQYLLGARAGQKMTVHVTSPRNRAKFDIYLRGDRSALANSGAEDTTDWEGELPESGDYVISVYSVGGNARYTLEVTIR
jgi:hypothetical protein